MSTSKVWVKSPHLRDYAGQQLELGEVFEMRNQANDYKLLRYEYVLEPDPSAELVACIGCGREFIDMNYRNAHARKAQHESIVVDGPNLKAPQRQINTPNPDGNTAWDLEPEGAPPPSPVEEVGVATDRGSMPRVRKGQGETFRLG